MAVVGILWSGGLDSTYLLWRTAVTTSDEIVVIHKREEFDTVFERAKSLIREFEVRIKPLHSFIVLDHDFITEYKLPIALRQGARQPSWPLAAYAAQLCEQGKVDKLLSGHEIDNDGLRGLKREDGSLVPGVEYMRDIFRANTTKGSIEFPLLETKYTSATAMALLPQFLYDLTLSCLRPCQGAPCGGCAKCIKRRLLAQQLDSGLSTDEVYNWVLSQSSVNTGLYWGMKQWIWRYMPEMEGRTDFKKNAPPVFSTILDKDLACR